MKRNYLNAELTVFFVKMQDVLTLSLISSNQAIVEDGKFYTDLFN